MPNLTTEGGGLEWREGWTWFRVHAAGRVCCGRPWAPDPNSCLSGAFEDGRLSRWIFWCGTEFLPSRSPLFLSIQGQCWGPKISFALRPVGKAGWPHGPSKSCRASPQRMYKLTRWVYAINKTFQVILCAMKHLFNQRSKLEVSQSWGKFLRKVHHIIIL